MVDRIRALLAWRKLTPTQFADLLQVGRPVISHILSGRNKASLEVVQRVVAAFPEVALPWLLAGTGPMLAAGPTPAGSDPATSPSPELTTTERADGAATLLKKQTENPELPARAVKRPRASSQDEGPGPVPAQPFSSGRETVPAAPTTFPIGSTCGPQPRRKFDLGGAPALSGMSSAEPAGIRKPDEAADQSTSFRAENRFARRETPPATDILAPTRHHPGPAEQSLRTVDLREPSPKTSVPGESHETARALLTTDRPIRRIVIFYLDGSFADFQPES